MPQTTDEQEYRDNEARLDLIRSLLDKLPTFDPNWPDASQANWFAAFGRLYTRIRDINAYGAAIRERSRMVGRLMKAMQQAMELVEEDSETYRILADALAKG